MKRFHVNMSVENLDQSIQFYSVLFGAEPIVVKPEYAKWMLDDPAVNFAIQLASETAPPGIGHLGLQANSATELSEISERLKTANQSTYDQDATQCCYAVSDKTWVEDPSGVAWETFFTHGTSTVYGEDDARAELQAAKAKDSRCC
ncbi:MAG: glyoxalase/bleomycin resistance/dioxygenase family protein [Robiginitomaculum sp.]|nr:MAG: glyoxalase/bleomycin resistance/dioxygenase family protein [Robiginitomaculum sp.]